MQSQLIQNSLPKNLAQPQLTPIQSLEVVQTIARQSQPQPLPFYIDLIIRLFNSAHLYYRAYKYELFIRKSIKNPSSGHPAVYGAGLHLIGDYTTIGKYAINVALVMKCTQDLVREYGELNQKYQHLSNSIKNKYPLYSRPHWKKLRSNQSSLLPKTCLVNYQVRLHNQVKQSKIVWEKIKAFLWQTFRLSMTICDCHLLLNGNSQARFEACTELVAEWSSYRSQLKNNQQFLLSEIQSNCKLADRILSAFRTTNRMNSIIDKLKNIGKNLKSGSNKLLRNFYEAGNETLETFYIKGKITHLSVNLTSKKSPMFPYSRFAPWAGKNIPP